jgi:hypothetical protein
MRVGTLAVDQPSRPMMARLRRCSSSSLPMLANRPARWGRASCARSCGSAGHEHAGHGSPVAQAGQRPDRLLVSPAQLRLRSGPHLRPVGHTLRGDVRGQRLPGWLRDRVAGLQDGRCLGGNFDAGRAELPGDEHDERRMVGSPRLHELCAHAYRIRAGPGIGAAQLRSEQRRALRYTCGQRLMERAQQAGGRRLNAP